MVGTFALIFLIVWATQPSGTDRPVPGGDRTPSTSGTKSVFDELQDSLAAGRSPKAPGATEGSPADGRKGSGKPPKEEPKSETPKTPLPKEEPKSETPKTPPPKADPKGKTPEPARPKLVGILLKSRPKRIENAKQAAMIKKDDREFRFAVGKASVLYRPPSGRGSRLPELMLKGNRAAIRFLSKIDPAATVEIEQKNGENELVLRLAEGRESEWDKAKAFVFEVTSSKEGGPTYWCRVQKPDRMDLTFGYETKGGRRGELIASKFQFAYPWEKSLGVQGPAADSVPLLNERRDSGHLCLTTMGTSPKEDMPKGGVALVTNVDKGVLDVRLEFPDLRRSREKVEQGVQWKEREVRKEAIARIKKTLKKYEEVARKAIRGMKDDDAKKKMIEDLRAAHAKLNKDKHEEMRHINRIEDQIKGLVGEVQSAIGAYENLRTGLTICDAWGHPVLELRFRFMPEGPGWEEIDQDWIERLWNPYRKTE